MNNTAGQSISDSSKPRRVPPWYINVGLLGFGVMVVCTLLICVPLFLDPTMEMPMWPVLSIGIFALSILAWFSWVVPVCEAIDARPQQRRTPRQQRRVIIVLPMMPLLFLAALLSLVLVFIILENGPWTMLLTYGAPLIPLFAIGLVIAILAGRRHRRTIADMKLCYHCGYDLRVATTDHCPECGTAIPW